jgi:hypothetical protein
MISAISRDHSEPVMSAHDVKWATALVRHCIEQALSQVGDNVADSDWELKRKAVAKFIRAQGDVSKTDLNRDMRGIDPKDRGRIVADLIAAGEVCQVTLPSGGTKPTTVYRWVG